MTSTRVVVIGGGPGGYSAALAASRGGASVTLIEADKPGGHCVNYACVPTGIMLSAIRPFLEGQELAMMGIADVGADLDWGRAVARKNTLVSRMTAAIATALKIAKVNVVEGYGTFVDAHTIAVSPRLGNRFEIPADAVIIATGAKWATPAIGGVHASKVRTADQIHGDSSFPATVLVLGTGPARTSFAVEYAYMLAAAGSIVTFVAGSSVVAGLDDDLDPIARSVLTTLGVTLVDSIPIDSSVFEVVVVADPRVPNMTSCLPANAGVRTNENIAIDDFARTNISHIYAVGDVAGGTMLSSAASHMGEIAGANAAGGNERIRASAAPHLLHTLPEIGWIGTSESSARASGHDVVTAFVDLTWSARAITLGGREGLLKLVAERTYGQILGVHIVGPDAAEILAISALAMQSELTLDDLAAVTHWHPSASESLAAAARQALTS